MADENGNNGCGCLFYGVVILIILGLIIGIPTYSSIKSEREREAQYAYEQSLPKAPDFEYTKEDIQDLAVRKLLWSDIEYSSLGDFVTTTFTIHNIECTGLRQIGIRKDKVDVTLKAYTYYIDGTITFSRTDKYNYNFNTKEWEYTAGGWVPTNVKIKG